MLRFESKAAGALVALIATACLCAATATAATINLTPPANAINSTQSVLLSSLLGSSDTIVVGDKVFSGFSYAKHGDMSEATEVNVLGFRDPDGNWGISLHGSFIDLPGGTDSDALIRFIVGIEQPTTGPELRISGANLFIGGVGVGDDSFFAVDESFLGRNEIMNAYASTLGPGPQQNQLSDSVALDPQTSQLVVSKDIYALAANGGFLPARATVIDQSFTQEPVPEPAAMTLLSVTGVALMAVARRRK